jgi:hypothetical protein
LPVFGPPWVNVSVTVTKKNRKIVSRQKLELVIKLGVWQAYMKTLVGFTFGPLGSRSPLLKKEKWFLDNN